MVDFADASERRDAMKSFLSEAPAEAVAEQTPTEADEVENLEDLLETPEPKRTPVEEAVGEGDDEEEVAEPVEEGEEHEEDEEEEEDADDADDDDREEETDAERDAREAEELGIETQELSQLRDRNEAFEGLVEALDGTDYAINFGETPEELAAGMQEVGLRLGDAHALYSIMEGKGADVIFERLKKFQGQEAHDFALNAVLAYAAKVGLIESADGSTAAAAKSGDKAAAVPADETPREKALRLENEKLKNDQRKATSTTQAAAAQGRMQKIGMAAIGEIERLGKEDGLDKSPKLMNMVLQQVMAQAGGGGRNKAVINRVARGNFVDIQRLYDEVVNEISGKRVATQNKKVQNRKIRDQKTPKRVAGEDKTTRTPAARQAADLSTSDGRRAAAKVSLRG